MPPIAHPFACVSALTVGTPLTLLCLGRYKALEGNPQTSMLCGWVADYVERLLERGQCTEHDS